MEFSLFSAKGCMRCKIIKSYMQENNIDYKEYDFKADGKEDFNAFYRRNRSNIFRGEDGIEFPILYNGKKVLQGAGVIIAFLKDERLVNTFITRSHLSQGWISGLNISSSPASLSKEFISVVSYIKKQGLKTEMKTDGQNPEILSQLLKDSLIDRLIFNLKGAADLYESITGTKINPAELSKSLALTEQAPDYKIFLCIEPFERDGKDLITVEEAGQAAKFVERSTQKKTHPFFIKSCIPEKKKDSIKEPNLFKYRTACRRYMVKTEIFKG